MKLPQLLLVLLGSGILIYFIYTQFFLHNEREKSDLFIYDKDCRSEADFVPNQFVVYGARPDKDGKIKKILECPCGDANFDSLYLVVYDDGLQNFEAEEEKIKPPANKEGGTSKNFIFDFPLMKDPAKIDSIKEFPNDQTSGNKISILDTGVKGALQRYVSKTGCPFFDRPDVHGHGSYVSYISVEAIAQAGIQNGTQYNYNIISYNVTSENGDIDLFNVMCALKRAARNGSTVINMSFGAYNDIPTFRKFIGNLLNKHPDLTLIASAGNEHAKLDYKVHVPSTYYRSFPDRVIQVSALNRPADGIQNPVWEMWPESNYVRQSNITAQGVHLFSGGYARGTSFAAPIVSGLKVVNYTEPSTGPAQTTPPVIINKFPHKIN